MSATIVQGIVKESCNHEWSSFSTSLQAVICDRWSFFHKRIIRWSFYRNKIWNIEILSVSCYICIYSHRIIPDVISDLFHNFHAQNSLKNVIKSWSLSYRLINTVFIKNFFEIGIIQILGICSVVYYFEFFFDTNPKHFLSKIFLSLYEKSWFFFCTFSRSLLLVFFLTF